MKCFTVIFSALFFGLQLLQAHAPFDSSVRMILHEDSLEVTTFFGASLAENALQVGKITARPVAGGNPVTLPVTMAGRFFRLNADTNELAASRASVAGDGLEFRFDFDYPLSAARSLRVEPRFMAGETAIRQCALSLCDENGNILGAAIMEPGKPAPEFSLPASFAPVTLSPGEAATNAPVVPAATIRLSRPSFGEFFHLGVWHILTGYDHLLFLAALLLGCRRPKPMLLVITGFTLAHSLTLALAALNVVNLSSRLVEPAIAASIIFVGLDNFRPNEKAWHRYALTCGFGLIHGFGFAGALHEQGLAGRGAEVVVPLFSFNLGVETGQLLVAAVLLPLLLGLQRWPQVSRWAIRGVSAGVILLAAVWLVQRIANSGD